MKNIIKIEEEIQIGHVVLEKGDKIEIITEGYIDYAGEISDALRKPFSNLVNDYNMGIINIDYVIARLNEALQIMLSQSKLQHKDAKEIMEFFNLFI